MDILSLIGSVFQPLLNLIDDVYTSDEEREKIKVQILSAQAALLTKAMEHEQKMVEMQSKVIEAEAKGESWLQRSWRPITMLSFLLLIGSYWCGLAPDYVVANPSVIDQVFGLLQLGIGGYIVGRSAEKVVGGALETVRGWKDK